MQNLTKKERAQLEELFVVVYKKKKSSKYKEIYRYMIKKLNVKKVGCLATKI